jgi:hypothetical protein
MQNTVKILFYTKKDLGIEETPLKDITIPQVWGISITFDSFSSSDIIAIIEGNKANILKNRFSNETGMTEDFRGFLIKVGALEIVT